MYLANTKRFSILEQMEQNEEISSYDLYHAKYQLMATKAPAMDRTQRRSLYQACNTFSALSRALADYVRPNSPYTLDDILKLYRTN